MFNSKRILNFKSQNQKYFNCNTKLTWRLTTPDNIWLIFHEVCRAQVTPETENAKTFPQADFYAQKLSRRQFRKNAHVDRPGRPIAHVYIMVLLKKKLLQCFIYCSRKITKNILYMFFNISGYIYNICMQCNYFQIYKLIFRLVIECLEQSTVENLLIPNWPIKFQYF